jgi:hypothetical protein
MLIERTAAAVCSDCRHDADSFLTIDAVLCGNLGAAAWLKGFAAYYPAAWRNMAKYERTAVLPWRCTVQCTTGPPESTVSPWPTHAAVFWQWRLLALYLSVASLTFSYSHVVSLSRSMN